MIAPSPNPAQLGTLDLTDERDRGLLRRRLDDGPHRRRWEGITEEFKTDAIRALKAALYMATEARDHRGINGCVKTLALLEGQNQKDEHALMGLHRNETTVNVAVGVGVELPRDRELRAQLIEVHARLEEADARAKMQQATEGPHTNGNGNGHA